MIGLHIFASFSLQVVNAIPTVIAGSTLRQMEVFRCTQARLTSQRTGGLTC